MTLSTIAVGIMIVALIMVLCEFIFFNTRASSMAYTLYNISARIVHTVATVLAIYSSPLEGSLYLVFLLLMIGILGFICFVGGKNVELYERIVELREKENVKN